MCPGSPAVVGIQVQAVVVAWQVFDKTGDPLALGLVGLFEIIPSISVALFAGHIADRKDRKKIVLICYTVLFTCSLCLLLLSTSLLELPANSGRSGSFTVWAGALKELRGRTTPVLTLSQ